MDCTFSLCSNICQTQNTKTGRDANQNDPNKRNTKRTRATAFTRWPGRDVEKTEGVKTETNRKLGVETIVLTNEFYVTR